MKKRILIISMISFFSLSFFSGCMMAGMHGIGGNGMGHHKNEQMNHNYKIVTKEYITDNFIITADFPSYSLENDLIYSIKVYSKSENAFIENASIKLILNNNENNFGDTLIITDYYVENETFYFQVKQLEEGNYNLKFAVNKINDISIEPNIEIGNNVHLYNISNENTNKSNSLFTPMAIIGGSAMILMMILKFSLF